MEQKKKLFKYYAIRVCNTVVFRRTVNKLKRVRSVLYNPRTEFRLEQVTYNGGLTVGCMSYTDWISHGGSKLNINGCLHITREQFKSMQPFIN